LLKQIDESLNFAKQHDVEIALVTEDTTRSRPDVLDPLFQLPSDSASHACVCATPSAMPHRRHQESLRLDVVLARRHGQPRRQLDWHGHNDRGLGVTNAIFAVEYGADRVHGTCLGIGERVATPPSIRCCSI